MGSMGLGWSIKHSKSCRNLGNPFVHSTSPTNFCLDLTSISASSDPATTGSKKFNTLSPEITIYVASSDDELSGIDLSDLDLTDIELAEFAPPQNKDLEIFSS